MDRPTRREGRRKMLSPVGILPTAPKPASPSPARSHPYPAASTPRNDASPAVQVPCGYSPPILASMVSTVPRTTKTHDRAPNSTRESSVISFTPSVPLLGAIRSSSLRPSPELGLLSLLFVLSMAVGSVLSLAIVSIPAINAFKKMADSMSGLSKVAAEELPGTLSSFKLSGLEIGELTQHLSNLRQRITGSHGKRERGSKSSPFGRHKRNNPAGDTF